MPAAIRPDCRHRPPGGCLPYVNWPMFPGRRRARVGGAMEYRARREGSGKRRAAAPSAPECPPPPRAPHLAPLNHLRTISGAVLVATAVIAQGAGTPPFRTSLTAFRRWHESGSLSQSVFPTVYMAGTQAERNVEVRDA